MTASAVRSVPPMASYYEVGEVAKHCGVDRLTARRWFEEEPGVLHRPRGNGTQKPFLLIPERLVVDKLEKMGCEKAFIESLRTAHDARIDSRMQLKAARNAAAKPGRRPAAVHRKPRRKAAKPRAERGKKEARRAAKS